MILTVCVAVFIYMAVQYQFHFDEMDHRHYGRRGWIGGLMDTNGGKTGVVIWTVVALVAGWYGYEAGWRFFSGREAAVLTERGLVLHPSYRRGGEIPLADVLSAEVGREPYSSWMFKTHDLHIRLKDRRAVRLRALTTEGGKEALQAFADELNARRAFDGGSGNKGHEGRS